MLASVGLREGGREVRRKGGREGGKEAFGHCEQTLSVNMKTIKAKENHVSRREERTDDSPIRERKGGREEGEEGGRGKLCLPQCVP